jgi:hypothetical protein
MFGLLEPPPIRDIERIECYIRVESQSWAPCKPSAAQPMKKRSGQGMKKTVKRRSRSAAALATARFRPRVVKSAKAYSRKAKTSIEDQIEP